MSNFIEVHTRENKPMLINIANISSITPYRRHDNDCYCEIVTIDCSDDEHYAIREKYEQVIAKIKRCTSAMVIE